MVRTGHYGRIQGIDRGIVEGNRALSAGIPAFSIRGPARQSGVRQHR